VTWSGRHFGFRITHTSRITALEFPNYFQASMVRGMFRRLCHDTTSKPARARLLMKDVMEFEAPLGPLVKSVERLLLERHMHCLSVETGAFNRRLRARNGRTTWAESRRASFDRTAGVGCPHVGVVKSSVFISCGCNIGAWEG
jgi:hypothetical protein